MANTSVTRKKVLHKVLSAKKRNSHAMKGLNMHLTYIGLCKKSVFSLSHFLLIIHIVDIRGMHLILCCHHAFRKLLDEFNMSLFWNESICVKKIDKKI